MLVAFTFALTTFAAQESVAAQVSVDKATLAQYIHAQYPGPALYKAELQDFLSKAAAAGLVAGLDPKQPAAQVFHALKSKGQGDPVAQALLAGATHFDEGPQAAEGAAIAEHEPNETRGWADALPCGASYTGAIAQSFEHDMLSIDIAAPSLLTAATSAGGGFALDDTTLELGDERGGFVFFDDDSGPGFYSLIRITLLPGRYYLKVGAFGDATGSYQLATSCTPATVQAYSPGMTLASSIAQAGTLKVFSMNLAAASALALRCNGTGGFDPILLLRNMNGVAIVSNDDAIGANSEIRINLPAGDYQLWVAEFFGNTGSFSLTTVLNNQVPIPSACAASTTGNIASTHEWDVYAATLAEPGLSLLHADTGAAGAPNATDTVVALYDRDFRFLGFNDDTATGLYSKFEMPLPAGTYYVVVSPYANSTSFGNYALHGNCSQPAELEPLTCGKLIAPALSTSLGYHAYALEPGTGVPYELRTNNLNYVPGDLDSVLAILGPDGRLLDWNDDSDGFLNSTVGARIEAQGAYAVLSGYQFAATGQTELALVCPLNVIGAPMLGAELTHLSYGKSGHVVLGLGGNLPGPPTSVLPFEGSLLLDLGEASLLGLVKLPEQGYTQIPLRLPDLEEYAGVQYWMQNVNVDALAGTGWFTNAFGFVITN